MYTEIYKTLLTMRKFIILPVLLMLMVISCKRPEAYRQPLNLTCNYCVNPIGIDDPVPDLTWLVNDSSRGAIQTAYQILVASDPRLLKKETGDVWDSKKTESSQSAHITYGGIPLESRREYFWKVKTWDRQGNPSGWSETASWEMGLLSKEDWKAKWIGMDIIAENSELENYGKFITFPENISGTGNGYFRKTFIIPEDKTPRKAFLIAFGNNYKTGNIILNRKSVLQGKRSEESNAIDVTGNLVTGKNLIALSLSGIEDKGLELIFRIEIIYSDGNIEIISSGADCKVSARKISGWDNPAFDDSRWINSRVIRGFGLDDLSWLKNSRPAPRSSMIRKEFTATGKILKARAYVTGLGNYKLFINGIVAGDDMLTPEWTDYNKRIQYQVYDIGHLLEKGDNAVGMLLGNMWWSSGLGWAGGTQYSSGPVRGLCQIEIEYTNGSELVIATDETWKAHTSPIVENTIYNGETYDARLEIDGWSEPGLDQSGWSDIRIFNEQENLTLSAQSGPPIRVMQELEPVSISEVEPGKFVYDMGINMVGLVRLKVQGEAGTKITLRFAELLHDDGTVAQENLRSAKSTDYYILKGTGEETWHPWFTYHGFRYVQIEGYPGTPDKGTLTGLQMYSSAPETGKFECSNDLLNKIWQNILNSQKGNMYSVPTDCPQRDERLGWTGDAQMFAPTANYNMNMAPFFTKWVRDMTDSQTKEGWICDVNPAIVMGGPGKPAWGDAITVVPWMVYKFYGDKKILENSYEGMKAWVEYMHTQSRDNLYIFDQNGWGGYGDWIAVVESPRAPISVGYYYYSTTLLARAAEVLGKYDDAETYTALAKEIRNAFNKKFLNTKTLNYQGATQTANLLPVEFGITPEEYRNKVVDNIASDVVKRGKHPSTGFLGTGYILPVLSEWGYHELAYEVATQTSYPSWGYMVEKGATSMWELWNSDTEPPDQMNSRNHFALGTVAEWFYACLAGIRPDESEPGFKHSIIAPMPADGLTWVEGRTETVYGPILCNWYRTDSGLKIDISIPPNTSATIKLPVHGMISPVISENGSVIFSNGAPVNLPESLKFIEARENIIIFDAGSGNYSFETGS
jgi:alpha-L-rhamnosidase